MCLLANLKCNELGIYFKMPVAYNNIDIQPLLLSDYVPNWSQFGHSFPGNNSTQMLLITTHSIHLEWSMVSSAM